LRIKVRLSLLLSIALGAALVAQDASIEWRVSSDVTPNDRKAIIELAHKAGMDRPRTVMTVAAPTAGCRTVSVSSDVAVDGNRVRRSGLDLIRADSKNCWPQANSAPRVGRWIANTDRPWIDERWRVRDGDWHLDVTLDDDVPYRDAERIVLAIRHKEVIDRLPEHAQGTRAEPEIDADSITSIQKRGGRGRTEYWLASGAGVRAARLSIAIVDGRVELYERRAAGEI
jgi:hypothetical protein